MYSVRMCDSEKKCSVRNNPTTVWRGPQPGYRYGTKLSKPYIRDAPSATSYRVGTRSSGSERICLVRK